MMPKYFLISGLLLAIFCKNISAIQAQTNYLEQSITLKAETMALDKVFEQLSKQCHCYFTYNARQINGNTRITFECTEWPLKQVLDSLLKNPDLSYQVIKNQVVIHPVIFETINEPDTNLVPIIVKGHIKNKANGEPLPYATVVLKKNYQGTISNENGFFQLKTQLLTNKDTLVFSYLGFYNLEIPVQTFLKNNQAFLDEGTISIQEVIVRTKDPHLIIKKVLENLEKNYQIRAYNYEAFYRESVKTDRKYSLYSEALISGYKPPLNQPNQEDKVQVIKARKFNNVLLSDTMMVKLRGGMDACFQLDMVHFQPDFLTEKGSEYYDYLLADVILWQNELVYVIGFKQKKNITEPLLEGKIYINSQNFAIMGADFQFAPEKIQQAYNLFVVRKSALTRVKPLLTSYSVKYNQIGNRFYIQYVRGELALKVRKRRMLFNKNFSTTMEMVYTHIDTLNAVKPQRKETFQTNTIFSDAESVYDQGFWNFQNIIEPEQNILEALKKSGFRVQNEGIKN